MKFDEEMEQAAQSIQKKYRKKQLNKNKPIQAVQNKNEHPKKTTLRANEKNKSTFNEPLDTNSGLFIFLLFFKK